MPFSWKTLVLIIGSASAPVWADDSPVPSALERDPKGWTDLLAKAGPKLEGWSRGPLPAQGKLRPASQWSLDSATGYLVCQGDGGHEWLRWDPELNDFVYHVEWRFTPIAGKKGYNSGIYARNSADGRDLSPGPDRRRLRRISVRHHREQRHAQAVQPLETATTSRVNPAGQWNTFEITCRGSEMTLWVNGAVTNEWHDCEVKKGHVGLEAEGWRIEFRNVKLKPLDDTKPAKS